MAAVVEDEQLKDKAINAALEAKEPKVSIVKRKKKKNEKKKKIKTK
jgi:predicted XRE-type DNA-binding protein